MIGYKPQLSELSRPLLQQLVQRIVDAVAPLKIVLFGSRARGDYRPDSHVDLLVIQDSPGPRHARSVPIYAAFAALPVEVDTEVVVFTPDEVADWRDVDAALVTTALREGKVLYEKSCS